MNEQISIFDYMDEKQSINIANPHITIENLHVASSETPKQKKKTSGKKRRKRGNILFRQTKLYENCEKRIFDGVGMNDIPKIKGVYDVDEPEEFIGFNFAMGEKHPENKAVHFLLMIINLTGFGRIRTDILMCYGGSNMCFLPIFLRMQI